MIDQFQTEIIFHLTVNQVSIFIFVNHLVISYVIVLWNHCGSLLNFINFSIMDLFIYSTDQINFLSIFPEHLSPS